MHAKIPIIATLSIFIVLAVTPLYAVQYGSPDGNGHPYIGLVVFYDSGKVPLWRCTGSLISSTVLLTAGHCAGIDPGLGYGPSFAQVWFSSGPVAVDPLWSPGVSCNSNTFTDYPCAGGYWGKPIAHPQWTGYLTVPNTHDVGVVVFKKGITSQGIGQLATQGYLDALATRRGTQNTQFTVVGYGLQSVKPVVSGLRERFVGTVSLVNLRSVLTDGYNMQYSNDPGQGNGPGGTCFGDSGGPVLSVNAQGQEVITSANSFVLNLNCKGSAFSHRVDIPDSRTFLAQFVTLP